MVVTAGKRSKRLLQSLSISQDHDKFLAPFIISTIRYNLPYTFRTVVQVSVHVIEPQSPEADAVVFKKLPSFLQSQLIAQNITDSDIDSRWTNAKPILHFVKDHLRIFSSSGGYPTLFRWRCEERRRSFVLLAFLEVKMASKTYSSRELLRMRNLPPVIAVYRELYAKVRRDAGLKEVIRLPAQALPLIQEEHQHAPAAAQLASATQLDGTNSEWRYLGRTESEQNEPTPISAPTGLDAQRDEGFQRFYQAVVSPTHVRVTAGGRIVPNTRGSSSPTTKWPKDRKSGDGASLGRPQSSDQPEPTPYPIAQPHFGGYRPMYPGFVPGMPHGLLAGQFPYMPFPYAYGMGGGYGIPAPPAAFNSVPRAIIGQSDQSTENRGQVESGSAVSRPMQLSPPEQFDPSRPYMYNGQYIMPAGHQFYPYGIAPPHAFTAASMNGPVVPVPQTVSSSSVAPQTTEQQTHPAPVTTRTSTTAVKPADLPKSSVKPPKSSILPSGITKNQISSLKHTLRYLEDQLQYNRHQIDERATEVEVQEVRQQIQAFEKTLEEQLASENPELAKQGKPGSEPSPTTANSLVHAQPAISATQNAQSNQLPSNAPVPQDDKAIALLSKEKLAKSRGPSHPNAVLNSSKSVSAFPPIKLASEFRNDNSERLRKVSSLPMRAALAPPFQPRQHATASAESMGNSSATSGGETEVFPSAHGLVAKGASEWKSFFKNTQPPTNAGGPYLVGQLPYGVRVENARDTDYVYNRELTEDELRARHMYWGKTPRHLQKGLPKFDGKDFYPPSPVKGRSTDTSSIGSHIPTHQVVAGKSEISTDPSKTSNDPFQTMPESGSATIRHRIGDVTQSESLPRFNPSVSDLGPEIHRTGSCMSQVSPSYASFRKALDQKDQSSSDTSNSKSSSDEGEDDKNLLFRGRHAMARSGERSQASAWHNMLKKGKSSAGAVPGKVSPMTAHGVLPNYSGHATASLTPTIANTTSSRGLGTKVSELSNARSIQADTEKRGENRPPTDVTEESLRSVTPHDNHHGFVSR